MTSLEELLTSLRELDELEAIHEDEELITLDDETASFDELLLDPSLELRMTLCDELLTSLRELEELEAINEEELDEGAMLDEDATTLEEDSGSGPERRDELEDFSEFELDELFTSLRELEDS